MVIYTTIEPIGYAKIVSCIRGYTYGIGMYSITAVTTISTGFAYLKMRELLVKLRLRSIIIMNQNG